MITNTLYNGVLLPPPLSEEETKLYFKMYREGSKSSYNALVEHNLRLVIYVASQFQNTGYELDDLTSIGNIGLIKSVQTFDLDKNIKFATYASRCISNEILMFLRKKKDYISLDEPICYDDEGSELKLMDMINDETGDVTLRHEAHETHNELVKAFNVLTDREKRIVYLLYIVNDKRFTQREIAALFHLSQSYISRLKNRACRKMANYIKSKYTGTNTNSEITNGRCKILK